MGPAADTISGGPFLLATFLLDGTLLIESCSLYKKSAESQACKAVAKRPCPLS